MEQLASPTVPTAARAATRSLPGQLDMRIHLVPVAVHTVRRVVADHLRLWDNDLEDLRDRTLLTVSELLTAALPGPNASQDLRLLVQRIPGGLCVNVHHRSPAAPTRRHLDGLLRAIADDTGVSAVGTGIDTWASILHRDQEAAR